MLFQCLHEFLHDVLKKKRITAEDGERKDDEKTANQTRHLSAPDELTRTASLLNGSQ